jgi:valyl-tRNA synthetase
MIETKTAYDPAEVEAKWTKYWFDEAVFNLDINPDKPSFSCALPPPNITGQLHMGHALNGTLQDVLIRWKRMQGYNVLWQPGTDHAGIATQMVVERELKKSGVTRHELGREKFLERVWQWRKDYGDKILNQYQRLGVSFAWDRIVFTMDEDYAKAIVRAFVTLFNEGYVYRGNRVTNWCPRCLTSLSDLEVEHVETKGHLYYIKYLLADGQGELIVATTRPETMFGDVAVAVNPKDERYKSFIGKNVILPIAARQIPVIADEYVDTDFGTGALKITPAHDANDWEVGQRHKLAEPVIIDAHGKLCQNEFVPAHLQGKERFIARKQVVEELDLTGLLAETKDYVHGVAHCERCHTVLEPRLSPQWYVRMKELAAPAIKVVEDDRVTFIPERYTATYLDWMRNIRDWCVSRQLWWGHRIPIWTCGDCSQVAAFESAPGACTKCQSKNLEQDPDVLDTWFSSALWPFATLGWPNETIEQKTFYPTTILSTAREIINLWVARMIFMSLKFKGTIPFKQVLIHPVIQTPDGKRMSKSKGNAVDPLDMIDKYGADANRFWFASVGIKGDQDIRFREDRLDEYKRFSNKLWNAGRLVLTSLEGFKPASIEKDKLTLADRWILNRYSRLLQTMQDGLRDYDFSEASRAIYEFTWDYFCDWYLEISKIQLADPNLAPQTKQVLYTVFEGLLRALHPIMPFITEELWSRISKSEFLSDYDTIMFAPYPRVDESFFDDAAEQEMGLIIKTIRAIRNIRQTYNVPPSTEAEVIIHCADGKEMNCLQAGQNFIARLGRAKPVTISENGKAPAKAAYEAISQAKIYVPLANLIDLEKTKTKLAQRKSAIEKDLAKVDGVLSNPDFMSKAPADKVETIKAEKGELQMQMASVAAQIAVLDES